MYKTHTHTPARPPTPRPPLPHPYTPLYAIPRLQSSPAIVIHHSPRHLVILRRFVISHRLFIPISQIAKTSFTRTRFLTNFCYLRRALAAAACDRRLRRALLLALLLMLLLALLVPLLMLLLVLLLIVMPLIVLLIVVLLRIIQSCIVLPNVVPLCHLLHRLTPLRTTPLFTTPLSSVQLCTTTHSTTSSAVTAMAVTADTTMVCSSALAITSTTATIFSTASATTVSGTLCCCSIGTCATFEAGVVVSIVSTTVITTTVASTAASVVASTVVPTAMPASASIYASVLRVRCHTPRGSRHHHHPLHAPTGAVVLACGRRHLPFSSAPHLPPTFIVSRFLSGPCSARASRWQPIRCVRSEHIGPPHIMLRL